MLKLFAYNRVSGVSDSKLMVLFLSEKEEEGQIFQKIKTSPFKKMVEFVSDVNEADFIIMPHDYYYVQYEEKYLSDLDEFAGKHGKKILVFFYGDLVDKVPMNNVLVLRTSANRSNVSDNEIILPAFIEDIGEQYGVSSRHKASSKPIIGFAGMVAMPTWKNEIKFQIKMFITTVKVLLGFRKRSETQGLYFRRRLVKILSNCNTCSTNFIIRNSFSALEKTITMDPKVLREEYIEVLDSSDLSLVVRGDGNFSLRFFEVLAKGSVPLFIDTDTPLPLENEIDYDSFMLRVDHSEMKNLPKILEDFWSAISDEEYQGMQKKAREVFETKLKADVFYKDLFEKLANRA